MSRDRPTTSTRGGRRPRSRGRRARQRGHILLGFLSLIVVQSIWTGVVVQEWSVLIQRDREQELMYIQEQYAAAILRWQQAKGGGGEGTVATPLTDLEQLDKETGPGGQRFIRKMYVDPMIPNATLEDWCLLKLGPAGRVLSTCTAEGGRNPFSQSGTFRLGEEQQVGTHRERAAASGRGGQRGRQASAVAASGQLGIVGVHSRSRERAFATAKRQEETYDRWYFTVEDYSKQINARAIPGLNQGQGPGIGGQTPGPNPGAGTGERRSRPGQPRR